MAVRTVRLDEQTERKLQKLRRDQGLTISEVFKRGLEAYAEQARCGAAKTPYDVYRDLELGEGGWALAPAREAKHELRDTIARKHRR
jgi:hypothetical protein